MRPETAMLDAFIGALAATLAQAGVRSVFGDQAANCVLLVLLWYILYQSFDKKPRGGRRNKPGKRMR